MSFDLNRRAFLHGTGAAAAGAALLSTAPGTAEGAEHAPGGGRFVTGEPEHGCLPLVAAGAAAPLVVSAADHPGVRRVAGDLADDLERVTGVRPRLDEATGGALPHSDTLVVIGTLGRSPLVDELADAGKLDVDGIRGQWETSVQQTVEQPAPGVRSALIIAGSDQRGTIFGVYELSRQSGVSPWYWWADVPAQRSTALYVRPGRFSQGTPAVRYRGLFINDEDPALGSWAPRYFGPGTAEGYPEGFNHRFYTRVFELMLRLKANYLWPAVWNRAFAEDDPENHATATRYGVVIGTSHEGPMLRGIEEWNRHAVPAQRDNEGRVTTPGSDPYGGTGEWSFVTNRAAVQAYWADGIRRMTQQGFEGVVTVGMRGNGDLELPDEGGGELMHRILTAQRTVLEQVTGAAAAATPQVWTLYKEVLNYWKEGLRPPDDVTVIVPDDNWGNLNLLPGAADRQRSGGFGLYYHFDYVGDGRNYKWVDTSPLPNIWDQLHQAYSYGIDRLWVVNVGDLKEAERPLQFFLDYAWAPQHLSPAQLPAWDEEFARQQFGRRHARAVSDVLTAYTALQARRKPELLNRRITLDPDRDPAGDPQALVYDDQASPFSLTTFRELERVTDEWQQLAARAQRLADKLPDELQAPYYQLVLYRVQATANLYALRAAEFTSRHYARQGRAAANTQADRAQARFAADQSMSDFFNNRLSGGKWHGFQSQPKIGYGDVRRYGPDAGWQQPERDGKALPDRVFPPPQRVELPDRAELGVAVDGSADWWPASSDEPVLPVFSPHQTSPRQYLEIFNRGAAAFRYRIDTAEPWVTVHPARGRVVQQVRATVRVDWSRAPHGVSRVPITVRGAGRTVVVTATLDNPVLPRRRGGGFLEAGGYVCLAAAHPSRMVAARGVSWQRIPGLGRDGDGMEPFPVTATEQRPGHGPYLEYPVTLLSPGPVRVTAYLSPRNAALPHGRLRYAVSFDRQRPQTVDAAAATGADPVLLNRQWERNTSDNVNRTTTTHTVEQEGVHTLRFWMIDPTVVVQRLLLETGRLSSGEPLPAPPGYSYLGPPESRRSG